MHHLFPPALHRPRGSGPPAAGAPLLTPEPSMPRRLAVACLLLSSLLAAPSAARTAGSIEGVVVDENGLPLPGVRVTVSGPGERRELVTGRRRRLDGLRPEPGRVPRPRGPAAVPGGGGAGAGRGGRRGAGPGRHAARLAAGVGQRRRRGAPDLRQQRRRRADDPAAVEHHQRDLGRRQPPRGLHPGGGRLRLRRLVEQRRRARLPGDPQRGPDRHHHRRLPQRHLRLLQRRQGEPLPRPGEPGRRGGLAGDRRHRLPVGGGPGRHLQPT